MSRPFVPKRGAVVLLTKYITSPRGWKFSPQMEALIRNGSIHFRAVHYTPLQKLNSIWRDTQPAALPLRQNVACS